MSPPSRLLPEVSGFTISFIGGSEVGRAGRGWDWNGWLHAAASRWSGEVSILWNGVECPLCPEPRPFPQIQTHASSARLPASLMYRPGREPDLPAGG